PAGRGGSRGGDLIAPPAAPPNAQGRNRRAEAQGGAVAAPEASDAQTPVSGPQASSGDQSTQSASSSALGRGSRACSRARAVASSSGSSHASGRGLIGRNDHHDRRRVGVAPVSIKCGESDTTTGLGSCPTVGVAVDRLLDAGATVLFGETSEVKRRALSGSAVNLTGIKRDTIKPGDVLSGGDALVTVSRRILAELFLHERVAEDERVWVHHGTRSTPAHLRPEGLAWQMRLRHPLLARFGDRLVVRRMNPPSTLGGGTVIETARIRPAGPPSSLRSAAVRPVLEPTPLNAGALALEERLRAAGHEPPSVAELGEAASHLVALRAAGGAVRVGRSMHAHPEAIAAVQARVESLIRAEGAVTLGRLRDELGTSRRYAQALLEYLDGARVTRRREDNSRVLRRSPAP
ncbi:MAG: SelB C-terminal domain-containing protein, partial [Solirubrobacteraceae bacterium]